MESLIYDTWEQISEAPEQEERKLPGLGPHRFKVMRSTFFDDSMKLTLMLVSQNDKGVIFRKLYLGDPEKASVNKEWMRAMLSKTPQGKLIDFDWESLEGVVLDATVGKFMPQDRDEEMFFVWKPFKCEQPKSRLTRDQKAKEKQSPAMAMDIPF